MASQSWPPTSDFFCAPMCKALPLEHQDTGAEEQDGVGENDDCLHLAIHPGASGLARGIDVLAEELFPIGDHLVAGKAGGEKAEDEEEAQEQERVGIHDARTVAER